MELEIMKKLIRKYEPGHTKFSFNAMQAERYYRNETDILINKISDERKEDAEEAEPPQPASRTQPAASAAAERTSFRRIFIKDFPLLSLKF